MSGSEQLRGGRSSTMVLGKSRKRDQTGGLKAVEVKKALMENTWDSA